MKLLKTVYILEIIFCILSVILLCISFAGETTNTTLLITSIIAIIGFITVILFTKKAINDYVPIPKRKKKEYIEYEEPDPEKTIEEFKKKQAKLPNDKM